MNALLIILRYHFKIAPRASEPESLNQMTFMHEMNIRVYSKAKKSNAMCMLLARTCKHFFRVLCVWHDSVPSSPFHGSNGLFPLSWIRHSVLHIHNMMAMPASCKKKGLSFRLSYYCSSHPLSRLKKGATLTIADIVALDFQHIYREGLQNLEAEYIDVARKSARMTEENLQVFAKCVAELKERRWLNARIMLAVCYLFSFVVAGFYRRPANDRNVLIAELKGIMEKLYTLTRDSEYVVMNSYVASAMMRVVETAGRWYEKGRDVDNPYTPLKKMLTLVAEQKGNSLSAQEQSPFDLNHMTELKGRPYAQWCGRQRASIEDVVRVSVPRNTGVLRVYVTDWNKVHQDIRYLEDEFGWPSLFTWESTSSRAVRFGFMRAMQERLPVASRSVIQNLGEYDGNEVYKKWKLAVGSGDFCT